VSNSLLEAVSRGALRIFTSQNKLSTFVLKRDGQIHHYTLEHIFYPWVHNVTQGFKELLENNVLA